MKATGMVRKVDELGRVVIPIETRRLLGIEEKDALEIYVDQDRIILRKYNPGCDACGTVDEKLHQVGRVKLCNKCASTAKAKAKGDQNAK